MLKRAIEAEITTYLKDESHKIFFIWGPRRSGKTTILENLSRSLNVPIFNFDILSDKELFVPEREALGAIALEHRVILIDEVQNSPGSTVALKILHDVFGAKVIATGSSELKQKAGEDFDSLSGRFAEHYCLPFSVFEIAENAEFKAYERREFEYSLEKQLQIFGAYPEVYANTNLSESEKIDLLQNILDTYVLKDIIDIYTLKNTKLARDILTKIALQIGSEVSVREIANSLQANVSTVANYIEIFIKNYILIPLPSFKTNIRRAISEHRKLYFYDLGIRNILVKDFRQLHLRPDRGGVFENFIISELEKQRKNTHAKKTLYFYREYGGAEVDLVIEDYKKNYTCMEVKIQDKRVEKDIFPLPHTLKTIDTQNYFSIIPEVLS